MEDNERGISPNILVLIACSVDLMLEEPGKRIKRLRIVEKARTLNFIYNLYDFEHDSSLHSEKDFVWLGITMPATSFLSLQKFMNVWRKLMVIYSDE